MLEEQHVETTVDELLESPHSRRHFLTGAVAVAAGAGLAPAAASAASLSGSLRAGMAETPKEILDIAATAEAAAVTALYHVHVAVNQGRLNTTGVKIPVPFLVQIVRAILRQEQDHYAFLRGAGAVPATKSFSFPPAIFTSATAALGFLVTADTIFAAAYMAANREFAQGGMPKLARYAYQIGGTECEHRALARAALGEHGARAHRLVAALPEERLGRVQELFTGGHGSTFFRESSPDAAKLSYV